ncbi:MAG: FAD-dependent monooxygenase [Chloroflexi bacterium]|nr:FAD-dependent monooxygenase [Chloroflexota bacterium]
MSGRVDKIPVLIVGGGPVGLTTSILLSRYGIRSLVVERHPGTSLHPKARVISTRSMEIFRQCSLESAIREAGALPGDAPALAWGRALSDPLLKLQAMKTLTPEADRALSPTVGCGCPQDVLEAVLLQRARENAVADVCFGHELLELDQTDCGATATIRESGSNTVTRVQAQYVVGADGAHSTVRDILGIDVPGPQAVSQALSILFRADLTAYVRERPILLCMIHHPDAPGMLLWTGKNGRWCFNAHFPEGARLEDFPPERAGQLVRTAVGVPDLPVEIVSTASFVSSARVAQSYSSGRVFLVGDAAHEMTPAGGHGMNTGIEDAHNLAWKLAAVVRGYAGPSLLDSYQAERQPVARWVTAWSLDSFRSVMRGLHATRPGATPAAPPAGTHAENGIVFGASYESAAVMPDGTEPPRVANPVTDYIPNARPGSRAPHVWLEAGRKGISTLDLFGDEFILLASEHGGEWCHAGKRVADGLHVPLRAFTVGGADHASDLRDSSDAWAKLYGVRQNGAVLVRPDGHVAWRSYSRVAAPETTLLSAFAGILGRATLS